MEPVHEEKPDIVPRAGILGGRIAESDDEFDSGEEVSDTDGYILQKNTRKKNFRTKKR